MTGEPQPERDRDALVQAMHLAGRELSTAAVNFHAAVATRRGLAASDTKALDLLLREGPMTHGQLRTRTGLAPASVTGLVDRLERAGLVQRGAHPDDGRSAIITADAAAAHAAMAPLFVAWVAELERLYGSYTDAELTTISDFMHRAANVQATMTARLVDDEPAGGAK